MLNTLCTHRPLECAQVCLTLCPPTWLHSNTLTMSPRPRCCATVRSRRASGGPNLPQRASLVCRHEQSLPWADPQWKRLCFWAQDLDA